MLESEFLDHRKLVIDNNVSNFESFKHGNIEESIQVSNYKENLKGERYFENIHENYVPNVKDHLEGSNKGGITSANDNNGENMALDNACVLNEFHLRTNDILSSNSLESKGDFPYGKMSSIFMEMPMCFPPKVDKYHF